MTTSSYNSWILDSAANICVCNQRQLFTDFVDSSTTLSRVISAGVSPGWRIVTLISALKNRQAGAQIRWKHILYIPQSLANLISSH